MSWPNALLFATSGVLAYVAGYYVLVFRLLRCREYASYAAFCASLSVFVAATAKTIEAPSPADAVVWQALQGVGILPALAAFVEFTFGLVDGDAEPAGAARHVRSAMRGWLVAALIALAAGLFFDPARADVRYDWGARQTVDAMAAMTWLGQVLSGLGMFGVVCANLRLMYAAIHRPPLRVAAAASVSAASIGVFEYLGGLIGWSPVHLATHATLVPVLGFSYVLIRHITEVDHELESTTRELAATHDHLRETQETLVQTRQLATIGELSAVIAHEIRNPLAILKNAVAGLGRENLSSEDKATLLEILDEETDRTNRLVDDLLAYAKPILPGAGQVDLRPLVMRAVELAAGGSRDISHIEIELALAQEVAVVEGDEALLRHALINIVDNALQAMPSGGTLTVSCRNLDTAEGRRAVAVDFHDTGEGMDTLVRSRARDPFFTTRQSGTGLGLAIVDRVARAHGGQIEIESRHGQGTTVSFVLPVERGSVVPEAG